MTDDMLKRADEAVEYHREARQFLLDNDWLPKLDAIHSLIFELSTRVREQEEVLEGIIKAHGRTVCNAESECEVQQFGCLGDNLHNEILKAKAVIPKPIQEQKTDDICEQLAKGDL